MSLTRSRLLSRFSLLCAAVPLIVGLAACNGGNPTLTPPPGQTFGFVRSVHGSPNAGAVDIYVYPTGLPLPSVPSFSNVRYPAITPYLSLAAGNSTIAVFPQGQRGTPTLSESVQVLSNEHITAAVTGIFGGSNNNLGVTNFIEPPTTAGQASITVHHASPSQVTPPNPNPIAVGIYDATGNANTNTQLFTFSYTSGTSGPAASGAVSGGQWFLSPLPGVGIPNEIGFVAGQPGAANGPLATVDTAATLQQLATNCAPGFQNATLAGNAQNTLPAGAHLSIFAVDKNNGGNSAGLPGGTLIGTLDP